MIKLDDNLLQELGLGSLPPEEKKKMLAHIYETLEMRVGMALAKQMNDGQLNEFEQFIKSNDEAGALHWLETNFPNYRDVVAAEFEKLKGEVKQSAPQIVAASQQNLAAAGSSYQQPMQPGQPAPAPTAAYPPQTPYGAHQQPMQSAGPAPQHQQYGPQPPMPGQPQAPQFGYGPQPQPQPAAGAPVGQPYYPPPVQPQPMPGQPPASVTPPPMPGPQPQHAQPLDPQQQSGQPYPPQQQGAASQGQPDQPQQ